MFVFAISLIAARILLTGFHQFSFPPANVDGCNFIFLRCAYLWSFKEIFHGDLNVFMKLMELEDVWIIEIWLEFEFCTRPSQLNHCLDSNLLDLIASTGFQLLISLGINVHCFWWCSWRFQSGLLWRSWANGDYLVISSSIVLHNSPRASLK